MFSPSRQPVKISSTILFSRLGPVCLSIGLKFFQRLPVISEGMGRQTTFLGQMPEKRGRPGIGRFAGFGFQAAAPARALAVFADLGLRGSRGGKSKLTFPSFHIRKAEKGRRVLFEINFSSRAVLP